MEYIVTVAINQKDFASYRDHVSEVLECANLEPTPSFYETNYIRAEFEDWFDEGQTTVGWDDVKDFVSPNYDAFGDFVNVSFTFEHRADAARFKLTFRGA